VAGCLPPVSPSLPASFLDDLKAEGQTFGVSSVSDPVVAAPIIKAIPGRWSFWFSQTRAEPVLGTLTCGDLTNGCQPGPAGFLPSKSRQVWLIIYPDASVRGDVPWIIVDAATGLENGAIIHDPRDR
jgi:hypothetical protein